MSARTRRPLPAVLPCLALVAGSLTQLAVPPACWSVLALAAVALGARLAGKDVAARAALGAAAFAAGAWLDHLDRIEARRRIGTCFRGTVAPEGEVEGSVVALAETDPDGQRWFRLRATRVPCAAGSPLVLQVRVASSTPEAAAAIDRLVAGDRIRAWARLVRPRGARNPGAPDPARSLRASGLDALASVKNARLVERVEPAGNTVRRVADDLKRVARRRLDRIFAGREAERALAGAVLLGDRRRLVGSRQRMLRDAGLIHLVAISGLHVGWLTLVLVGAIRRGGLTGLRGWPVVGVVLTLFALGVGARPSVLRAATAALVILGARAIGRDGRALNTLALIAAGLVVLQPAVARDVAFQLSFAAAAGIVHLAPGRPEGERSSSAGLAAAIRVSAHAYASTAPLVASHIGRLAPAGLITGVPGVALGALLVLSGYTGIVFADVAILGDFCGSLARASATGLLTLADHGARLPWGSFAVARPAPVLVGLTYALLAACGTTRLSLGASRRLARCLLAGSSLGLLLAIHLGPPPAAPGQAEVAVVDVGQGQAVVVRGDLGRTLLVDAGGRFRGPDPGERIVVPYLLREGVRRLDALVLSHEHLDHIGGAPAVLRDLEVGELWVGPRSLRHPRVRDATDLARRRGIAIVVLASGDRRRAAGSSVAVLAPARDAATGGNEDSLVLRIGVHPHRVLLPGDVDGAGESALLAGDGGLRAEALVLAHHGSRAATSDALLDRVRPCIAVVSAGRDNRFGHPHPEVRQRLAARRIPLWRTDRDGRVLLVAAPGGWSASGFRE